MLKFGLPRILHCDNGKEFNDKEFKSKLIENLSQQLGMKKRHIFPCHPETNGKVESSHRFITYYILTFSVDGVLEWDQLLPYAKTAFSWFSNEHAKESPHFL